MAFFIDEFDETDYREISQSLDTASDWFKEVVEILYGKTRFDAKRLENALDEISSCLKVKLPRNDLNVMAVSQNASVEWLPLCKS